MLVCVAVNALSLRGPFGLLGVCTRSGRSAQAPYRLLSSMPCVIPFQPRFIQAGRSRILSPAGICTNTLNTGTLIVGFTESVRVRRHHDATDRFLGLPPGVASELFEDGTIAETTEDSEVRKNTLEAPLPSPRNKNALRPGLRAWITCV